MAYADSTNRAARRSQSPEDETVRRFLTANKEAVLMGAALVLTLAVFWPGMQAGFVGDSFNIAESTGSASFMTVVGHFVPAGGTWYRPTTDLIFWLQYQAFGMAPFAYHLFALLCHALSGVVLYLIARRLTGNILASVLGASVFLLAIQAQEVVFDVSDGHNAVGGVVLLATIYAYITGRRGLAFFLAILTFSVDETGLLLLPIMALYELVYNVWGRRSEGAEAPREEQSLIMTKARRATVTLLPFAGLLVFYLLLRTVLTPGGFFNETQTCHSPRCIASGLAEYLNRLFVRPDALLRQIWTGRVKFALVTGVGLLLLIALLRPWAWRNLRVVLFSLGWVVGSVLYYILALWEYIADRFLYVPYMGLGLLIAAICAEVMGAWHSEGRGWRLAQVGVAAAMGAWLLVGGRMLVDRGELWVKSGIEAQSLVEQVHNLMPNPPSNALFVVSNVPGAYYQEIPPGNTGPHLFNNGMDAALRMRYGRGDLAMSKLEDYSSGKVVIQGKPPIFFLKIDKGRVALANR